MTEFTTRQELARIADVTAEPAVARHAVDRSFELPTGLYAATVAAYLGFVGVMAGAFANPGLALPLVVFALFIIAAFGTPMLWVRMNPGNRQGAMSWQRFKNRGIQTGTGQLPAGAAAVQVLILPVLILGWGIAVAVIAALT